MGFVAPGPGISQFAHKFHQFVQQAREVRE